MKAKWVLAVSIGLITLFGCSQSTNEDSGSFTYNETSLNQVLLAASQAQGVTYAQIEQIILPPSDRALFGITHLGKYLFGDEYVDSLAAFGGTPIDSPTTKTNTWSLDGSLSETVNEVTGCTDDLLAAAFHVTASAVPANIGKYHVYRYVPWIPNTSSLLPFNVWAGVGHVIYFNPVKGQVSPGQPYLELFPSYVSGAYTTEIEEVRIEHTSYYHFRGLMAGNGPSDQGSSQAEMEAVLGAPTATASVPLQKDIDWNLKNTLTTYPIDGSTNGAYIHYDKAGDVKVRIFLAGAAGGDLHITAMYFVRTP
jgi:hypothetical protein